MIFSRKDNTKLNFSLLSPAKCISMLYTQISLQAKIAFAAAMIAGLSAHLYQFTNKLYNYDELRNTPGGYGLTTQLGRWFLEIMSKIVNKFFYANYSLPFLTGLLCLLLLAVSASLVVSIFRIDDYFSSALIGGLMAVFPAVTCTYYFMFTAVYYMIGNFMSILSAYLVTKFPKSIFCHVVAILLLACSLGTYQAYFPNAVCIFVILLILKFAFSKEGVSWQNIIYTAIDYLIVLVGGVLIYFAANQFFMKIWNIELWDYQGVSSMGHITWQQLVSSTKLCYQEFIALFSDNVFGCTPTALMRKCLLISIIATLSSVVYIVIKQGETVKKIFMTLGILIMPIAFFLIKIMAPYSGGYALMTYPVVFLPVFLLCWSDCFCRIDGAALYKNAIQWITSLSAIVIVCVYIWYANGCYMSLEYTKYHDLSYYQTIITQIKSLDDYSDDMHVIIIGNNAPDDMTAQAGDLIGGTFSVGGATNSNLGDGLGVYIMRNYLGFTPAFGDYMETAEWMEREEVKNMPCYPADNSIKIIDNTIIVKMCD